MGIEDDAIKRKQARDQARDQAAAERLRLEAEVADKRARELNQKRFDLDRMWSERAIYADELFKIFLREKTPMRGLDRRKVWHLVGFSRGEPDRETIPPRSYAQGSNSYGVTPGKPSKIGVAMLKDGLLYATDGNHILGPLRAVAPECPYPTRDNFVDLVVKVQSHQFSGEHPIEGNAVLPRFSRDDVIVGCLITPFVLFSLGIISVVIWLLHSVLDRH